MKNDAIPDTGGARSDWSGESSLENFNCNSCLDCTFHNCICNHHLTESTVKGDQTLSTTNSSSDLDFLPSSVMSPLLNCLSFCPWSHLIFKSTSKYIPSISASPRFGPVKISDVSCEKSSHNRLVVSFSECAWMRWKYSKFQPLHMAAVRQTVIGSMLRVYRHVQVYH
jgi:hypothetical protein